MCVCVPPLLSTKERGWCVKIYSGVLFCHVIKGCCTSLVEYYLFVHDPQVFINYVTLV